MLRVLPTLHGEAVTTHDYEIVFPIDDVPYMMRFSFNRRMGRWVLSIRLPDGKPVVTGTPVLHDVDLFTYAAPGTRPRGLLMCIWRADSETGDEPGEFDLGARSILVHVERPDDFLQLPPQEARRA